MSRIGSRLETYKDAGKTALVSFVTAGDPSVATTVPALHALVRGGVDILELGVPFSDPEAEGPAIQKSSERALANGVDLVAVLEMVCDFRRTDANTPVLLMGYYNSLLRLGHERFAKVAVEAGVDGVIIVNLPPEEAMGIQPAFAAVDLDLVFLIAPTTTETRARSIVSVANGFIYYVSLKGVTGAQQMEVEGVRKEVLRVQSYTELPVMVGFGVKDAQDVRRIAKYADGVVVGSALVRTMDALQNSVLEIPDALEAQVKELRDAIDESDRHAHQ
ncbi:MAG TPA: tryptophan synthase subunit alpha [Gammaproteobacteria bacterium]|nr:tryptophan synthase subunit alpha [Gammaproteobacteria bacterium]